ncbi:AraC family transcriptional regulator [Cohnella phaseoli]|uniref:Iron complex transport system substrate-binding protein n=1 Tax=Cohnella phaseoli TaxID=456490 RepID=A0A3D9KJJ3_9BACL|nr:AraC family transcriptional regulator [Cohnella phaseoli]RED86327.1 iron complex transport system substrate-binding protein [Cohnella phaseoli]
MKLDEHTTIWNHTAVKISDIRHIAMSPGETMEGYRLPASCFMYSTRGRASVALDGVTHQAESFYLLHGAKGMQLEVAAKESFDFYLLFYRTTLVFSRWKEIGRLLTRSDPFSIQYGFRPSEPLGLYSCLRSMERTWTEGGKLGRLQATGLFYQFVHELLWQLKTDEEKLVKTDFVTSATRYLHSHYQDSITLQSLAEQLNYSVRHFAVSFKQQTGVSPIEYLIRIRISHACRLMAETGASLRDIASQVGYPDVYYFNRIFKKQTGLSPSRYQAQARQLQQAKDSPFILSGLHIGTKKAQRYIRHGNDNHYQYNAGGSSYMKRNSKSAILFSMLISLTMVLSACTTGGGSGINNAAGSAVIAPSASSAAAVETETTNKAATRVISTEKGDVEVPLNPQRVVVMYLIGDIAALGVKPVGISEIYAGAAFTDRLTDADSLGPEYDVNPESVMALKPDLIIVATEFTYDKLKSIAPTVYVPYEKLTTEQRIEMLGKVFGKEQEAKALLEDFRKNVETSKQKLQAAGVLDKTVTIMEGGAKEMFVVQSTHFGRGSQLIYDYLGMEAPDVIQNNMNASESEAGKSVSMEVLPEYAGDYIVRSSWEGMDDLSKNKIWNSIEAVKAGRIIEAEFGLFFYTDPLSLNKQLDLLTGKLLETAGK